MAGNWKSVNGLWNFHSIFLDHSWPRATKTTDPEGLLYYQVTHGKVVWLQWFQRTPCIKMVHHPRLPSVSHNPLIPRTSPETWLGSGSHKRCPLTSQRDVCPASILVLTQRKERDCLLLHPSHCTGSYECAYVCDIECDEVFSANSKVTSTWQFYILSLLLQAVPL